MDPEELSKAIETITGTLDNFDTLLHNHMTDYATKFGRLKAAVEGSIRQAKEIAEVRDKALHDKINGYKWGLILVASFAVVSLGGFVSLALVLCLRGW